MRTSVKFGAIAAVLAVGFVASAMSCGSTRSTSGHDGSDDAGSPADAGRPDGDAGKAFDQDAVAGADVNNDEGRDGAAESGAWVPSGDPGWKPVPWASGCDTKVAAQPENAVAPLEWIPCGAAYPGCQRLVISWPSTHDPELLPQSASVYQQAGVLRVALVMGYDLDPGPGTDRRAAIFDESMRPIAAWRSTNCNGLPRWASTHVCFPLTTLSSGMHEAIVSSTDPVGPPLAVYESSNVIIGNACDDDLLGGFGGGVGGTTAYVRDLANGNEHALTPPSLGETYDPVLVGSRALTLHWWGDTQGEHIDGWIWQRPNDFARLVPDQGGMLYDLRSDGTTLVWIRTGSKSAYDLAPGEIWTSPFDPDPAKLQPMLRRATPTVGLSPTAKVIGNGYYALIEQIDGSRAWKAHVYRLSDMRHWEVPTPSDVAASDMIAIDDQEVWFFGQTPTLTSNYQNTIIRQRLADLGAGD